jgi:hypothetical protein
MASKARAISVAVLLSVALAAFFAGRRFEEQALAARLKRDLPPMVSAAPPPNASLVSYRELRGADIIALPFSEFYEALRSAPAEARKKWATELEQMPTGPRRTAALSGFYKLLIQFDPAIAVKAIADINDEAVQNVAVEAAAKAAPGFAIGELAALMIKLPKPDRGSHSRDPVYELLSDWTMIDPPAVAQFLEEHPRPGRPYISNEELIPAWAALDPKTARDWMESHNFWQTPELRRAFIDGWYENDRAAAVSYVLANAADPDLRSSVGNILRGLYYDSKEEARKFIERLPDGKMKADAFHGAFENSIFFDVEENGEEEMSAQAVRDWMVEFPPAYWNGTLSETFKWTRKPAREILAWIERQPLAIRSAVAAEYVPGNDTSTSDVIVPILEVSDQQLREELLITLLKHTNPFFGEVGDKLDSAPISAEQKDYVLRLMARIETETAPVEQK